jgi:electron transport complex protein RnfD
MWLVSLAALLAVVQSSLSDSFSSLIIAVTAVIAAFVCEFIIYFRTEKAGMLRDGSAVASALVFTLMLPNEINPIYAAAGVIFAVLVVKSSFGGLGANWLNPAVGGWLFIRLTWGGVFDDALVGEEAGVDGALSAADAVGDFLNTRVFSLFGAELPDGYLSLFNAGGAGIIADRGALALLVGTIILAASQAGRVWIPVVYLVVYGALIRLFGALPAGGAAGGGDVLAGFLSGGTLAAAFFLLSDPATGAKSLPGAAVTAALAAIFSFIFRYYGAELYGAFFAVALLNALVPVIRGIESRILYMKPATSNVFKARASARRIAQ